MRRPTQAVLKLKTRKSNMFALHVCRVHVIASALCSCKRTMREKQHITSIALVPHILHLFEQVPCRGGDVTKLSSARTSLFVLFPKVCVCILSFLIGMAATIPVYPLDVLRTRLAVSTRSNSIAARSEYRQVPKVSNVQMRSFSTTTSFPEAPRVTLKSQMAALPPQARASTIGTNSNISTRCLSTTAPVGGAKGSLSGEVGALTMFRSIIREEGTSALFRGLAPTLYAIAPFIALQQATYVGLCE